MKSNILTQLLELEKNELKAWYDMSDKENDAFYIALAEFADDNQTTFKEFCLQQIPSEETCLSIVYEAITKKSNSFNALVFDEIKRVIQYSKNQKEYENIDTLLWNFDLKNMYQHDFQTYTKIISYLISEIKPLQEIDFNIIILDTIDYYLIDFEKDKDDKKKIFEEWKTKLEQMLPLANKELKEKIEDLLEIKKISSNDLKIKLILFALFIAGVVLYRQFFK